MPCGGGAVNAELTLRGVAVVTKRRVEGYERFDVKNSAKGERYVLRVTAVNQDELRRIQAIEVLATTREQERFPLPSLPAETRLHEYPGLARCDSVTVGWVAAPDPLTTKYCVSLTEDLWGDSETARTPNQCGLDNKGRQRTPNRIEICMDKPLSNTSSVITQTIHRLKHGQRYVVQVTAKKSKGRTLSYDLLQVRTKSSCSPREQVLRGEQTVFRRTP
uniref:Protein NDNF n=1 Tax=Timema shepardi TaxID=629360 RepID=A0A7R9B160_TIMSH|nr:unnamed protein product [Timema shepardi]